MRATRHETEAAISDSERLLLLLDAAEKRGRQLTTSELQALSHLVSTARQRDGSPRWPHLRFRGRFAFSPAPTSDELYDNLQSLERAGLVVRQSPVVLTDAGRARLEELEREIPDAAQVEATAALAELASEANLVDRSIDSAVEEVRTAAESAGDVRPG